MLGDIVPLLVVLLIAAAIFREDTVFTVIYLVVGVFLVGRWLGNHALSSVRVKRIYPSRVFLDEVVSVRLEFSNAGRLPVLWLLVSDSIPVEVSSSGNFRRVFNLNAHGRVSFQYPVYARKRGYYQLGPLSMRTGDFLGLSDEFVRFENAGSLIVYPKVIPLSKIDLPSRTPYGTIKHRQTIFADPSRVLGKRPYQVGDSLRIVDWKASAVSGELQVKLFDASIALETAILLNLNPDEYELKSRFTNTELAIVVAASIANWIVRQKQAIGLWTNGIDPFEETSRVSSLPPRKGQGHLMRILDLLARIQASPSISFLDLMNRETRRLPWGTTLILITSQVTNELLDELFQARRRGLNPYILQIGDLPGSIETRRAASQLGFPVHQIVSEDSLDIWRH